MKLDYFKANYEFDARSFNVRLRYDKELAADLIEKTKFLHEDAKLQERVYCYFKNITEQPVCPICGKPLRFRKFGKGYFATCGDQVCKSKLMGDCNKPDRKNYKQIQEKLRKTYSERHPGYDHNMKDPKFLSTRFHAKFEERLKQLNCSVVSFNDDVTITFKCNKCGKVFEHIERDVITWHANYNLPFCDNCYAITTLQRSSFEREVSDFLSSLGIVYMCNKQLRDAETKHRHEYDIIVPDKKILIECNGLYWHSAAFCGKKYHYEKKQFAEKLGYSLIQIWEDDWYYKTDIIKSRLCNKLNLNNNHIYARECIIKEVEYKDAEKFLNENHIQGNCLSSVRYGLFYQNVLVMLSCFGKTRKMVSKRKNEDEYELLRLCSKCNYSIIGGFSKLLSHFLENFKVNLISYVDLDWSNLNGSSYELNGFTKIGWTGVDYTWYLNGKRNNRLNFTKAKLKKLGYDTSKTEDQIMTEDLKAYKIYGTGNMKYQLCEKV